MTMQFGYFCAVKAIGYALGFVWVLLGAAQSSDYQTHHPAYRIADRYQSLHHERFYSAFKPYKRSHIVDLMQKVSTQTNQDDFNKAYILIDNWEQGYDSLAKNQKPLLKHFYVYQNDFFGTKKSYYDFHINPIWQAGVGSEKGLGDPLFINSRGLEFRGSIDERVSFYSMFTENQARFPSYIQNISDTVGVIPYEGFWKSYNETASDFFRVTAHLNVDVTEHIALQLGFGRHFIGHGQRSLFLSDFANNYPYLRSTFEFWKIRYTNLFAQMTADVGFFDGGTLGASDYPNKYFNGHYFDISILPNLNIGIFESVIYGKPDSLGGSRAKMEYFVPLVFLRGVEQQDGSGDNSMLGLEFKWSVWKRLQLYGQFMLDDFSFAEQSNGNNWWGNKYGYQLGTKVYDVFVPHLDLQLEYNGARPFHYAHQDLFTSYTHYRQPLGHPLGANFSEILTRLDYQAFSRLNANLTFLTARYGNDLNDGFSYGRDPLKSYNLRNGEYGHQQGQGDPVELWMANLNLSYQLYHNLFLDFGFTWREENFVDQGKIDEAQLFRFGFRWNSFGRSYLF